MSHFDVVIVGAGSAGCALASRLSENTARSVLLLEAGDGFVEHAQFPSELLDASTMAGAAQGHAANWSLDARLTASKTINVPRGKAMGGSSTVNGGVFVRSTADDFDRWAALGNEEWSFAAVLPFLKRLENDHDFAGSPYHGDAGPVPVVRAKAADLHPLSRAFVSACADLGFPEEADKNAPGPPGCGPLPRNIVDGVRVNAALAYIVPHRDRPNLSVESQVRARRVVFSGDRAVGVQAERAGRIEVFFGDEIVLCAGAVMSPHLLLVSGIGPAEQLRGHGVPAVVDLPGVGRRCRDHPQLFVAMDSSKAWPTAAGGVVEVALDTVVDGVPVALMPYLTSMADLVPGSGAPSSELVIGMLLERAVSAVEISLVSADPARPPAIHYHSLDEEIDRMHLQLLVELGVAIADSPAVTSLGLQRVSPHRQDDLDAWVHHNIATAVHLCSGAPMGPDADPMAVVDQRCRVRGVNGLRVVDTSVLPTAPSRGPACTAVLIGERASAFFDAV